MAAGRSEKLLKLFFNQKVPLEYHEFKIDEGRQESVETFVRSFSSGYGLF